MIDAYQLYQTTLSLVNKEENGVLTVSLFNTIAHAVEIDWQNKLVEVMRDPVKAQKELAVSEDMLFPFNETVFNYPVSGSVALPVDYAHFNNMRCIYNDEEVVRELFALNAQLCQAATDPSINTVEVQQQIDELLSNDSVVNCDLLQGGKVAVRLKSFIPGKRPTAKKPICERKANGFQIYPKTVQFSYLSYYRTPTAGVLSMTIDPAYNDEVYDQANSRAFEWPESALPELSKRISQAFAIYVREKDLFQMMEAIKKEI